MSLWSGRRAPMTLLGGYLGAGKTTIVNHALAEAGRVGRRIAVLVNDLGTVNVDAALIAAQHDDTIELANGCICCSLVDGLAVALETLRDRTEPPDHVVVELSGVAEPARVVPWASTAGFRLDAVVVVADADQIRERAADARLAGLVDAQLAAADLVLVSKTDLVDVASTTEVERWIAGRTSAPQLRVVDGAVTIDVLLGSSEAGGARRDSGRSVGSGRSGSPAVDGAVVASGHVHSAVPVAAGVGADALAHAVDALAAVPGVVRAKGVVQTADGPRLVQLVGRRGSVRPVPGPHPTSGRTGHGSSVVTVIALDPQALETAADLLASCSV